MTRQKPTQLPLQELSGVIERVTYQNEENGYTVAKLIPRGKQHEVAIVGNMTGVNPGESVKLQGYWITHPKYGKQFEISDYKVELPATVEGIRKYLGSGLVHGIGPVTASSIVDHFGIETLEIIENTPQRLREVPGIGGTRTYRIKQAWEEQKQIKEIMLFLQSHGVSTGLAVKIYKQYEDESIAVVRNEPYRLAKDIFGVGFKTADKIARQMGLAADSPERIQAGLLYAMGKLSDDGHCYATQNQLVEEAAALLELQTDTCPQQIEPLTKLEELIKEQEFLYLPPFYYAEVGTANKIKRIQAAARDRLAVFQNANWIEIFGLLDDNKQIRLTDQQKAAVRMTLAEKVSVLTGGPGTGKSTITKSIIQILRTRGGSVLLAAPTGRAAKRLSEATNLEAKTIHRLLEFSPTESSQFKRNEENPLDADLIIVDEASMIDIILMNRLMSAIDAGSHLLLVGDVDQLPSVGPGNVLKDIIASQTVAVTRLNTIFRQAEDSFIIVNAHRINDGEFPLFAKESRDFFLFPAEEPQKAAEWVLDLVTRRITARFGFDPLNDIQVLSPMHRGAAGVAALNSQLQEKLNPAANGKTEIHHGSRVFRAGDRVMQIRNDYERIVFNGDMGIISKIDLEEQLITVDFEGHWVTYEPVQLDELVHAYAISVHKSQGSEYPVVVILLLTQHYMMLQRNLLYTGVTRAKKMVVLVGNKKAIAMAVRNDKISQRNTMLVERLQNTITP